MTDLQPGRRWWRKKRWVATLLLWMLATYLLSVGPARYAAARGWISPTTVDAYFQPVDAACELGDAAYDLYDDYLDWCEDVGEAASD
ncbi:MAG TPA: hypothetical protein VF170_16495 [Planctomycetaceae bacterium]